GDLDLAGVQHVVAAEDLGLLGALLTRGGGELDVDLAVVVEAGVAADGDGRLEAAGRVSGDRDGVTGVGPVAEQVAGGRAGRNLVARGLGTVGKEVAVAQLELDAHAAENASRSLGVLDGAGEDRP